MSGESPLCDRVLGGNHDRDLAHKIGRRGAKTPRRFDAALLFPMAREATITRR
jgi:hypothetical protein